MHSIAEKTRLSEPTRKNWICQRQKCRPMTILWWHKVYDDIRGEVPWGGGVKRVTTQRTGSSCNTAVSIQDELHMHFFAYFSTDNAISCTASKHKVQCEYCQWSDDVWHTNRSPTGVAVVGIVAIFVDVLAIIVIILFVLIKSIVVVVAMVVVFLTYFCKPRRCNRCFCQFLRLFVAILASCFGDFCITTQCFFIVHLPRFSSISER